MRYFTHALLLLAVTSLAPLTSRAQDLAWEIESLTPDNEFVYNLKTGAAAGTNGVLVRYGGAVMTAERIDVDQKTGEAIADGHVHIQRADQIWVGEHIEYNFKTRTMRTDQFRTGKPPVFVTGNDLAADNKSDAYFATNVNTTSDDYSEPAFWIHTHKIKIIPGKYVEAYNSVFYLDGVPVFWLPYYRRSLDGRGNHFNFAPGYRSRFGPFLMSSYDWVYKDELEGMIHLDYRLRRGVGVGPDVNYDYGRWGKGSISYYYMHDLRPNDDNFSSNNIPSNRQQFYFSYLGTPYTNFSVRSQVRYQRDPRILRDFFEPRYRNNPQPDTYVEVNKFWDNFSLDLYTQPRINRFFETVERLPDIRLTGFRQQLGDTPIYYESESSFAYLRRRFAVTNGTPSGLDYSASRADTHQQLTIPHTFFGWLNVTPHAGGRFTAYSDDTGPGGTNSHANRGVFNTGMEVSFKASRLWPEAKSKLFDMNGLRHIVEPSADYVYVPRPNRQPKSLPMFDYSIPTLRLQPIDFPEFNSIDNIDAQNVLRFGVKNKLQTKRDDEVVDLLSWEVFTDWRVNTMTNQTRFSDVYSILDFNPRSWLNFESETLFDTDNGRFRLAYHTVTIMPSDTWHWTLGHYYLHDDPVLGVGNNLITSTFLYRFNENWSVQFNHNFEARDGHMQEQSYALFRDFRGWTAQLLVRWRDNRVGADDFTVFFACSLKAFPHMMNIAGGGL